MSEFKLNIGEGEMEISPERTLIIMHKLGKTAINDIEYDNSRFDNFTIDNTTEGGKNNTMKIYREQFNDFTELSKELVGYGFPAMVNKQEVSGIDRQVYTTMLDRQAEKIADTADWDKLLE